MLCRSRECVNVAKLEPTFAAAFMAAAESRETVLDGQPVLVGFGELR